MPRCASSLAAMRVLDGLGGRGRVAGAAELAPGGARELVLAAVPARGRDRGRVAADSHCAIRASVAEPPPWSGVAGAVASRAERGDAEAAERRRAGDAVDDEAVVALVVADRAARDRTDTRRRRRRRARAGARPCRTRSRRPGRPLEAGPSAATAPPATRVMAASSTAPPPRPARLRRRLRAASARRRREALSDASHGPGFAGSMKGTAYLLGLGAYGVSCRARAKTCATPRIRRRFAPWRRSAGGSPVPRLRFRRGLGLCSVQEGGKDRHITPPNAA